MESLPGKLLFEKYHQGSPVQVCENLKRRELHFGNPMVQSAYSLKEPKYPLLRYTRQMLAGIALVPKLENVLHIGLGGGSIAKFLYDYFPRIEQTAIEINPLVIEAAYEYFELPDDSRLKVIPKDIVESINDLSGPYDLIFLDAFDHSGASSCFDKILLQQLQGFLSEEGWLVGNFIDQSETLLLQKELWDSICSLTIEAKTAARMNTIVYGFQSNSFSLLEIEKRAYELEKTIPLRLLPLVKRFHFVN